MNIKKMLKNSKNNDVFVKPIHSENKEFDGRYLLFIRSSLEETIENKEFPPFRIKITKDKNIPRTLEEINKLEYVIITVEDEIAALDLQKKGHEKKVTLYPDEFGYLRVYRVKFSFPSKNQYYEDTIYLGNFDMLPPEKEYIRSDCIHLGIMLWETIDEDTIKRYQLHNLKDPSFYNHELANTRRKNYLINKRIHEEVDRHTKEIMEKYGDIIEKILANEPYTEDSLTYVGPEDEVDD